MTLNIDPSLTITQYYPPWCYNVDRMRNNNNITLRTSDDIGKYSGNFKKWWCYHTSTIANSYTSPSNITITIHTTNTNTSYTTDNNTTQTSTNTNATTTTYVDTSTTKNNNMHGIDITTNIINNTSHDPIAIARNIGNTYTSRMMINTNHNIVCTINIPMAWTIILTRYRNLANTIHINRTVIINCNITIRIADGMTIYITTIITMNITTTNRITITINQATTMSQK